PPITSQSSRQGHKLGASQNRNRHLMRGKLGGYRDRLLGGLKAFIDSTTKNNVTTPSLTVNGIPGVTYGDYGPPRTWIDWWFKKGDTMICMSLQSIAFPYTEPTQSEKDEHTAIICSIKYLRYFPSDAPPLPE